MVHLLLTRADVPNMPTSQDTKTASEGDHESEGDQDSDKDLYQENVKLERLLTTQELSQACQGGSSQAFETRMCASTTLAHQLFLKSPIKLSFPATRLFPFQIDSKHTAQASNGPNTPVEQPAPVLELSHTFCQLNNDTTYCIQAWVCPVTGHSERREGGEESESQRFSVSGSTLAVPRLDRSIRDRFRLQPHMEFGTYLITRMTLFNLNNNPDNRFCVQPLMELGAYLASLLCSNMIK